MNKKKAFWFLSLILALSFVLSACAGGTEPTAAPTEAEENRTSRDRSP